MSEEHSVRTRGKDRMKLCLLGVYNVVIIVPDCIIVYHTIYEHVTHSFNHMTMPCS